MRRPMIAGNWKLFKTPAQTREFLAAFVPAASGVDKCDIVIAPPFTSLAAAVDSTKGTNVHVSAQNVHWEKEGAFTGEVSAPMLAEVGCGFVIVGHSERRQYFGETDETVSLKTGAVLESGMQAIVCVGETLGQRDSGDAEAVVAEQLNGGLGRLTASDLSHIIVAYEPVWAIGTGKTATPEIAQTMHGAIRGVVSARFGAETAAALRILYGGSVKPENIGELMAQPDIDGGLVGGASLDPESFKAIIRF